ncbi:MAG: hypothetical protein JHC88_24030, partial [Niveispirillum sp.]|nr:hypothetical protein [Niveispirillum sp.]
MTDQDYLLSPTRHADDIAADAPALAAILRKQPFKKRGERFERADTDAIKRQSTFRWLALLAHGGMGVTTVLTAVALGLSPDWDHTPVVSWYLGLGAAAAGVCGTIALIMLRQGNKLRRWMEARAEAETERLAYFKALVDAVPHGDPVLLEQVLDYIYRYQVR